MPVDLCLFVFLSLFMPLICAISARLADARNHKRQTQMQADETIPLARYYVILTHRPQHPKQLVFIKPPLTASASNVWAAFLLINMLCVFFAALITLVPNGQPASGAIMLLGHFFYGTSDLTLPMQMQKSIEEMGFAYLGWFIWAVSNIFSRMVSLEIVPATYYNILARLVIAVVVALLLGFLPITIFQKSITADIAGFLAGFCPDTMLSFITSLLRKTLLDRDKELGSFPLQLVQGINGFRQLRLAEMGLENCLTLAKANPIELYLQTNLTLSELVDWIGQAQLALLVGEAHYFTLQANGYRTILDIRRAALTAAEILATLTGYTKDQITGITNGLDADPSFILLQDMNDRLNPKMLRHGVL